MSKWFCGPHKPAARLILCGSLNHFSDVPHLIPFFCVLLAVPPVRGDKCSGFWDDPSPQFLFEFSHFYFTCSGNCGWVDGDVDVLLNKVTIFSFSKRSLALTLLFSANSVHLCTEKTINTGCAAMEWTHTHTDTLWDRGTHCTYTLPCTDTHRSGW